MKQAVAHLGNVAAVLGMLLCLVAGLARVAGMFYVVGFEAMTLYTGGMGLMLAACLVKLHLLGGARATKSS
jgi:hypothetical protein